jgi:hypothetical protein
MTYTYTFCYKILLITRLPELIPKYVFPVFISLSVV